MQIGHAVVATFALEIKGSLFCNSTRVISQRNNYRKQGMII